MGVFWGWGFRKNNDQEVKDLKAKVETNTANIVNLENTKANKSYVDDAVTFTGIGINNIPPNGRYTYTIPSNSRPLLVRLHPSGEFFTNWAYDAGTQNLTITNNTTSTQSFSIYIIVKRG